MIRRSGQKVHVDADRARPAPRRARCRANPVVVLGDEEHLERMVSNLATNAVKFTPDGGRITLRVRTEGPRARDRGAGHRRRLPRGGAHAAVQPLLPHHPRPDRGDQRQRPRASRSPAASRTCTVPGSAPGRLPGRGSTFTVTFDEEGHRAARRALTAERRSEHRPSEIGYFSPSVPGI